MGVSVPCRRSNGTGDDGGDSSNVQQRLLHPDPIAANARNRQRPLVQNFPVHQFVQNWHQTVNHKTPNAMMPTKSSKSPREMPQNSGGRKLSGNCAPRILCTTWL